MKVVFILLVIAIFSSTSKAGSIGFVKSPALNSMILVVPRILKYF
ncbi:hypothetical protein [Pseudoalteromonas fuliginea]